LKSLSIDRAPEKRALRRWVPAAAGIAVLAALAFAGWKLLSGRVFAPEVDTATIALISPAQGAQLLVATGYVVPQRKANISPRIGGRVAKIFVEDGTVVKAGQVIAVLEDADYRAQLAQAHADFKSAQAREKRTEVDLQDAQRQYEREQILQRKGVSTPAALDTATARPGSAKATVTDEVAFVDEAKDVLHDMGAKVTFLNRQLDEAAQNASPTPAIAPDAVVDRGETKAVFVVQQNETVKSVPVVTGPPLGNLLSLREGPPPGTRVVRSPPADLKDGMRVKEKQ